MKTSGRWFAKKRSTVALGLALCAAMALAFHLDGRAQQAAVPQRQTSTPYTGDLSVFDYKDRDKKLQIGRVMDLLGMEPGKSVADIGAGSGWFTVRAAARVGQRGEVFAEDINPEAVKTITARAQKANLANVHAIQGTPDDPKLPRDSVDAVLMLKCYHEIAHPEALLGNLKPSLKPGAKVGIIDRNGNAADHGVNQAIVEKELSAAGFHRTAQYDFTKADGQDYFLIFQKN